MDFIDDPASLEALYGPADAADPDRDELAGGAVVDRAAQVHLARSTLLVVSTVGRGGVTSSPRGGPPGTLVRIHDANTVWVPDAEGGRTHQTVRNLMEDPRLGLVLFAPPQREVLRLEGLARVSADPLALAAFADLDPPVRSVLVVDVQLVRMSGAAPLARAGLWPDPAVP